MTEIRCPRCGKLIGYFEGKGETACPRCRRTGVVRFDTAAGEVFMKMSVQERR